MSTIPAGYTVRPVSMADLETTVALLNAYSCKMLGVKEDSVETLKHWWQSPDMNLSTDTRAIFTAQGQMAGYSEFIDRGKPHVRLLSWSNVHPDYWGRGLGKYLLEWSIQRARQNITKAPDGTRVVLQHFAASTNQAAAALFTTAGFQPVRSQYVMHIDFDQPPRPPVLPHGIAIRPINGEEEQRSAMFAAHEAFKDHWGNTNPPFEEYYRRFKIMVENDPFYDPSLWFIALDSVAGEGVDAVAGVSFCSAHMDEDPDMAWVGTLGVRRPWRKRGIGQALLQHSFYEFYRRGKKCAGLGVDASSLTGAVRLYEHAGMHVDRQMDIYELELRPGKDLMRQSIDEPSSTAQAEKVEEK